MDKIKVLPTKTMNKQEIIFNIECLNSAIVNIAAVDTFDYLESKDLLDRIVNEVKRLEKLIG